MTNPKAYFPGHTAQISYRKVDKWAVTFKQTYFDTWEGAHAYMLENAKRDVERAKRGVVSAERHLKRVMAMAKPNRST